jgi:drug/metabolite transporter (DMT)-like permease
VQLKPAQTKGVLPASPHLTLLTLAIFKRPIFWLHSALLGFLGCFFYYICLYMAYSRSLSMHVLVIQYTWPVLTVILSAILLKEPFYKKLWLACILGFAGVVLIITKGQMNTALTTIDFSGLSIVLIAAFSFALYSVLSKKISLKMQYAQQALLIALFAIASLFSLLYVLFTTGTVFYQLSWLDAIAVIINGGIINGLSYIWWLKAAQLGKLGNIACLVFFTPVLASFWLFLVFDEPFYAIYLLGLICIILSGWLSMHKE